MGGLNSSYTAETAVYSAQSLVKGDSQWKLIPANGWEDNWPVYSQTGITMNSKIYFFGIFLCLSKGILISSFVIRWLERCPVFWQHHRVWHGDRDLVRGGGDEGAQGETRGVSCQLLCCQGLGHWLCYKRNPQWVSTLLISAPLSSFQIFLV